jgi:hypothetical protein
VREVLAAIDPLARALDGLAEHSTSEEQDLVRRFLRGAEARLRRTPRRSAAGEAPGGSAMLVRAPPEVR